MPWLHVHDQPVTLSKVQSLPTIHTTPSQITTIYSLFWTQGQNKVKEGISYLSASSLKPIYSWPLCLLRSLECPASTSLPVAQSASAAPPDVGLNSSFLCLPWLPGSGRPPGISLACGLIMATTSRLCLAQQAHQQTLWYWPVPRGQPLLMSLSFCFSTEKSNWIPWAKKKFG